jgi:hypothetical protein
MGFEVQAEIRQRVHSHIGSDGKEYKHVGLQSAMAFIFVSFLQGM